jgi:translation initiation factor 2B subunit (eIF-2B alpha/beta/delta family)
MIFPPPIQDRIDAIRGSRTSGAAELTAQAADVLSLAAELAPDSIPDAARLLVAAQPAMAPLVNLTRFVLAATDPGAAAREFLLRMRAAAPRVAGHAARFILDGCAVLTHSYSSTVFEAFLAARQRGRHFHVICTESRPLCEGAALAASLGREGIEVTLILDAAIASFLPRVALVLVGADAVSSRGLVNKTGTALLALAASRFQVPMYALCGSEKFLPPDYELRP